jgi:hypothetical protein
MVTSFEPPEDFPDQWQFQSKHPVWQKLDEPQPESGMPVAHTAARPSILLSMPHAVTQQLQVALPTPYHHEYLQ